MITQKTVSDCIAFLKDEICLDELNLSLSSVDNISFVFPHHLQGIKNLPVGEEITLNYLSDNLTIYKLRQMQAIVKNFRSAVNFKLQKKGGKLIELHWLCAAEKLELSYLSSGEVHLSKEKIYGRA